MANEDVNSLINSINNFHLIYAQFLENNFEQLNNEINQINNKNIIDNNNDILIERI